MVSLRTLATRAVDSIRINSLRCETRNGRSYWVKERQPASRLIIPAANWFFQVSHNPVTIHKSIEEWRNWEIDCYQQLNGGQYVATREGERSVCAAALPGTSLCEHLSAGAFTAPMAAAAGRELRRVHLIWHPAYEGPWSHSDPHTGNLIYEPSEDRVRLIDFETMHNRSISSDERHADDLLVFLQDLVARVSREEWMEFSLLFLENYGRPEIHRPLNRRLQVPSWGAPRLWWLIRTACMSGPELRWRLAALREALSDVPAAPAEKAGVLK